MAPIHSPPHPLNPHFLAPPVCHNQFRSTSPTPTCSCHASCASAPHTDFQLQLLAISDGLGPIHWRLRPVAPSPSVHISSAPDTIVAAPVLPFCFCTPLLGCGSCGLVVFGVSKVVLRSLPGPRPLAPGGSNSMNDIPAPTAPHRSPHAPSPPQPAHEFSSPGVGDRPAGLFPVLGVQQVGHVRGALPGEAVQVSRSSLLRLDAHKGRSHHPRQDKTVQGEN